MLLNLVRWHATLITNILFNTCENDALFLTINSSECFFLIGFRPFSVISLKMKFCPYCMLENYVLQHVWYFIAKASATNSYIVFNQQGILFNVVNVSTNCISATSIKPCVTVKHNVGCLWHLCTDLLICLPWCFRNGEWEALHESGGSKFL